ncbi:MAG: hypothetical protein AVDCRST_MAG89-144, partial [uncultured Gemmatimonadetes bacterium]
WPRRAGPAPFPRTTSATGRAPRAAAAGQPMPPPRRWPPAAPGRRAAARP